MVTRDDAVRGLAAAGLSSSLLRRSEAAERGLARPEEPRGLLPVGLSPVDRARFTG